MIRVAEEARVDEVRPGYEFLSENLNFSDACVVVGLSFVALFLILWGPLVIKFLLEKFL